MIALEKVRSQLATIWFGGSAVIFMLLVVQSLGGMFGDQLEKAWAWAIPNIAPTLSLMISVFAAYALMPEAEEDKHKVRRVFFRLSTALSSFYILNVVAVIVAAPFAASRAGGTMADPVDVMHTSNFWLGPLQGFTAAALAAVFFTKSEGQSGRPSSGGSSPPI